MHHLVASISSVANAEANLSKYSAPYTVLPTHIVKCQHIVQKMWIIHCCIFHFIPAATWLKSGIIILVDTNFQRFSPFLFHQPPLSSVTKARHNLLTGIMELLIINVIFSSFPKIYSELSSAGGTRHISQSNLPQKLPVSFRWTGVKRRRQRLILQAEIIPGILPANCIHVLHVLLEPLWIPLLVPQAEILVSYKDTLILRCMQAYHVLHCVLSLLALC